MAEFEKRDNSGAVFKNTRKETDKHPDCTGTATIEGKDYWVSGWLKQDRNGNQFLSLAFKRKDAKDSKAAEPPAKRIAGSAKTPIDMNDEIPF